jgi:hypothetical protein
MEYLPGKCDNTCNYSTGAVMDWLKQLVSNQVFLFFFAVIGIPVIVMGTIEITKLLIRHRERMAMIEHGMDPYAHEPRKSKKKLSCMGSDSRCADSAPAEGESSEEAAATGRTE